jgi:hypothetical protein
MRVYREFWNLFLAEICWEFLVRQAKSHSNSYYFCDFSDCESLFMQTVENMLQFTEFLLDGKPNNLVIFGFQSLSMHFGTADFAQGFKILLIVEGDDLTESLQICPDVLETFSK